ncbi:MAG: hypothetical protein HQM14_16540 [SAR324 cluster bacterium]|nr:hypothetical protein [SAR324 cluster bacterium]
MLENIDWMASLLVIAGGIIIVFAGLKILKNGISMLFWVLMFLVGAVGIGVGLNQENLDSSQIIPYIKDEIQSGSLLENLPKDAFKSLCQQIL